MRKSKRYQNQEAHWRKIIEDWQVSGEKIKSFCAARKVAVSGFYNWRGKLYPHLKAPSRNIAKKPSTSTTFLPVEIHSPYKEIEPKLTLNMPNGCWIKLNRNFDAVILKKLLEALGGKNVDVT